MFYAFSWLNISKLIKTYFIPFSVNRLGSSCKMFCSKKSFVISGSKSGSSPINWKLYKKQSKSYACQKKKMLPLSQYYAMLPTLANHLKQDSLSEG